MQAAAHMVSILATKGTELIPKAPVNATMRALGGWKLGPDATQIAELEALGEKHLGCGHDI
jgi:hypothetical protein